MLRIHFTTADLARMRIAARPDPLWELMLSMHVLRLRDSNPLLSAWRQGLIRHTLTPLGLALLTQDPQPRI